MISLLQTALADSLNVEEKITEVIETVKNTPTDVLLADLLDKIVIFGLKVLAALFLYTIGVWLIRKIKRLHITIPQKEELFALINQCARDEANVKVEKKKISMFKLRGAARKAQKLNVRKLKDTLRRSKAELERKLQARLDEDYRFIPTEAYVAWFFGILGLVVVVGVLWIFHEPILEWLKGLIGMLIDNNSTGG